MTIDNYKLGAELGRGASATVVEAEAPDGARLWTDMVRPIQEMEE